MTVQIGFVMDPIETIHSEKDSTWAMMLASQCRQWSIYYIRADQLWWQDGKVWGVVECLTIDPEQPFSFVRSESEKKSLDTFDVLMVRKDPPFDMQYIYMTYLLEAVQAQGVLLVNNPKSLRDCNEKVFVTHFPQCMPPTVLASQPAVLRDFACQHEMIVLKPLDGMGGKSVFKCGSNDKNLNVIMDLLTDSGQKTVMAQRFVPEISSGDKRLLLINGEPVPYVLARIPPDNDFRGNMAIGARSEGQPISDHDRWIAEQVGPTLRDKGLLFVGLDIIGDYLTEINVTSPTGVRELDRCFNVSLADELLGVVSGLLS